MFGHRSVVLQLLRRALLAMSADHEGLVACIAVEHALHSVGASVLLACTAYSICDALHSQFAILQLLRFCLHARNSQTSKSQFAMLAIYGLLAVCMQFTCCLHAVCASLHKLWPTNAIRKFYDFTLRAAVCLQLASNLRVLVCMQRACNLLSVCLNF